MCVQRQEKPLVKLLAFILKCMYHKVEQGDEAFVYVTLDFCRCISTSSIIFDPFTFEANPFGWIRARWVQHTV